MRAVRLLSLALPFLAASLAAGPARAAEITRHDTRLTLEADGTGRALTTLVVAGAPAESLDVPLGTGTLSNLRLAGGPAGLLVEPPKPGARTFRVTLPGAAAAAAETAKATSTFSVSFDVRGAFAKVENPAAGDRMTIPRESRTLAWSFVNTQAAPIGELRMLVALPDGYRVHAIREQLPKQGRAEAEPRVRLGKEEGRQNALLHLDGLAQGDDASMKLEVLPSRRSPLWLVAGALLSLLYLVGFRDLVARPADSQQNP